MTRGDLVSNEALAATSLVAQELMCYVPVFHDLIEIQRSLGLDRLAVMGLIMSGRLAALHVGVEVLVPQNSFVEFLEQAHQFEEAA